MKFQLALDFIGVAEMRAGQWFARGQSDVKEEPSGIPLFLLADYPHVKHRKCRSNFQLSAISRQEMLLVTSAEKIGARITDSDQGVSESV